MKLYSTDIKQPLWNAIWRLNVLFDPVHRSLWLRAVNKLFQLSLIVLSCYTNQLPLLIVILKCTKHMKWNVCSLTASFQGSVLIRVAYARTFAVEIILMKLFRQLFMVIIMRQQLLESTSALTSKAFHFLWFPF
jgi:hypothetical protein